MFSEEFDIDTQLILGGAVESPRVGTKHRIISIGQCLIAAQLADTRETMRSFLGAIASQLASLVGSRFVAGLSGAYARSLVAARSWADAQLSSKFFDSSLDGVVNHVLELVPAAPQCDPTG